jgi:thiamine-phosphate pyrophosphorylase
MAALETQVVAAARAGVELVQVREPDLEAAELSQLVRSLLSLTTGTSTRIIVNDRLDVALSTGAAGVHLKERSFPVDAARKVSPKDFVIGRSTHDVAGAASAGAVDYLIAGTVLPTVSKPSAACLGWPGLSAIVRAAGTRPVLAIGGLDLPSIPFVAATGSAGVAAIGAFLPEPEEGIAEFVQKRVIALRLGFDSAHPVS